MEDTLVDDVSRGASLVVEGKQRNNRGGSSVEASQPQQILPQDTAYRREAKERTHLFFFFIIHRALAFELPVFRSLSMFCSVSVERKSQPELEARTMTLLTQGYLLRSSQLSSARIKKLKSSIVLPPLSVILGQERPF